MKDYMVLLGVLDSLVAKDNSSKNRNKRGGGFGIAGVLSISGGRVSPSLVSLISILMNIYSCITSINYLRKVENTENEGGVPLPKCNEIDETSRKIIKGSDTVRIIIASVLVLFVISLRFFKFPKNVDSIIMIGQQLEIVGKVNLNRILNNNYVLATFFTLITFSIIYNSVSINYYNTLFDNKTEKCSDVKKSTRKFIYGMCWFGILSSSVMGLMWLVSFGVFIKNM